MVGRTLAKADGVLERKQMDADLEDEMRLHVELRTQQAEAGITPDEAGYTAQRFFGNALLPYVQEAG
jgi:hypothetical protein